MGTTWTDTVTTGWTEASLHHLVMTKGTLSTAKTKDLYGHVRTKTQMRGIAGSPYWIQNPLEEMAREITRLNKTPFETVDRLKQLRMDKIGGILLVTQVIDETEGKGVPFITILAAPSTTTFNETTGDVGVTLDDIWDPKVLQAFQPGLDTSQVHCPVVGAQEGFSRSASFTANVIGILQDAQPLFIPEGELLCTMIEKDAVQYPRAIFLPEVCNMPTGIRWPATIGFTDFLTSVQAILGPAGNAFKQTILALEPMLKTWFEMIAADTATFIVPGCPLLPLYDDNYPAVDTGAWPDTVQDQEGFSPLMDLINGHVWRLWCDRALTTESKINREHLNTFLKLGAPAITADTYLGAKIPGRFCPNYAYHFTVVNGWPTDTEDKNFLGEFQHEPIISFQAKQYDPVAIDLHQPNIPVPYITTREERTSAAHKGKTPKYSYPDPAKNTPTASETARGHGMKRKQAPYSPAISIPSTVKDYNPSPAASRQAPRMQTHTAQRRLEDELAATQLPLSPQNNIPTDISKSKRLDPKDATVSTAEGRAQATDHFLNACRLLAHHSVSKKLKVGSDALYPDSIIYVREPCGLYRREILSHLSKYSASSGFMPQFSSFMEAVLRPAQVHVSGVYDPNFFSGTFLHAFLSVESWMVNDHILPSNVPNETFHVYRMIACLQPLSGQPLSIPPTGLTQLQAKQIGILTYYLFAMMDLEDGTFSDRKFESSILGQRLKAWSQLPDGPMIHSLWNQSPVQASYQWFASLQALLHTMQSWIKRLRYHKDRGFYHARDEAGNKYLMLDSQLPSHIPGRTDSLIESLRQYDTIFETRWFRSSFMDSIWTAPLPSGHGGEPIRNSRQNFTEYGDANDPIDKKRLKLAGLKHKNPDFICQKPPMEVTTPVPAQNTLLNTLFGRFQRPIQFPRLKHTNGTLQTICLNSAFTPPHNCCLTRLCGDRKNRIPRLHIDLSREPWRSKPEAYWLPLVKFLQDDAVYQHIRPTEALKRLTPSAKWH
jgi:hypothetical protein